MTPDEAMATPLAARIGSLIDGIHPVTAVVYADAPSFEAFLRSVTGELTRQGMRLAGLIQESRPRDERSKCDIHLTDLATGEVHGVSDDRGPAAQGCRLNVDRLLRAGQAAERGLSAETDLLVLCKFGKTEAGGGGLRSLLASALELAVPVLIGVPRVNLEAFRAFAGNMARELDLTALAAPVPAEA